MPTTLSFHSDNAYLSWHNIHIHSSAVFILPAPPTHNITMRRSCSRIQRTGPGADDGLETQNYAITPTITIGLPDNNACTCHVLDDDDESGNPRWPYLTHALVACFNSDRLPSRPHDDHDEGAFSTLATLATSCLRYTREGGEALFYGALTI